nr:MAG TPA: hypothetical protein [Caudoviricetes sp.]
MRLRWRHSMLTITIKANVVYANISAMSRAF